MYTHIIVVVHNEIMCTFLLQTMIIFIIYKTMETRIKGVVNKTMQVGLVKKVQKQDV